MKNKIILPVVLIVALCILIGTLLIQNNKGNDKAVDEDKEQVVEKPIDEDIQKKEVVGSIDEYFLMNDNTLYVYKSETGESQDYSIFNLYSNENTLQRIIVANFNPIIVEEVLKYDNEKLLYINGTQRGTLFENLLEEEEKYEITVLAEPLQVGTVWQMSGDSTSVISDISAMIETELGSFSCIEITTNYSDGTFEKTYYAKGIGLVKTISTTSSGQEVVHNLVEVVENKPYELEFSVFYLDLQTENNLVTVPTTIEIDKNMNITKNIENSLKVKEDGEKYYSVLNGASINFIEVNDKENYVHIDLSGYDLTNVGISEEQIMIDGLVNNLSLFSKKGNIKLTVDGNNYVSSHLGEIEGLLQPKTYE